MKNEQEPRTLGRFEHLSLAIGGMIASASLFVGSIEMIEKGAPPAISTFLAGFAIGTAGGASIEWKMFHMIREESP